MNSGNRSLLVTASSRRTGTPSSSSTTRAFALCAGTEAKVRAIFNAEEGWLVVLADHAVGGALDGRVDSTRTYYGVAGQ
jgi:hypothetical protein